MQHRRAAVELQPRRGRAWVGLTMPRPTQFRAAAEVLERWTAQALYIRGCAQDEPHDVWLRLSGRQDVPHSLWSPVSGQFAEEIRVHLIEDKRDSWPDPDLYIRLLHIPVWRMCVDRSVAPRLNYAPTIEVRSAIRRVDVSSRAQSTPPSDTVEVFPSPRRGRVYRIDACIRFD